MNIEKGYFIAGILHLDPYVIDTVLDSGHYKLSNLGNREGVESFHINCINLAFVPTQNSTTTTQVDFYKLTISWC